MSSRGTPQRSYRCEDRIYGPAQARARAEGHSLSELIVAFLLAYGQGQVASNRRAPADRAGPSTRPNNLVRDS